MRMMTLEQAVEQARKKIDEYEKNGGLALRMKREGISKWVYVKVCEADIRNEWENFQHSLLPMPDQVSRFCWQCAENEFDFGNFRYSKCGKCREYSGNYWRARRIALAWWREPTAMRDET